MVDRPPEVVSFAIDPDKYPIEVPALLYSGPHRHRPPPSDFRCKHRPEPIPPSTHRLMAYVDATLMEQILDLPQRQRETDIHHYGKADNLG